MCDSTIKKGALVKAWDDDYKQYDVATYYGEGSASHPFEVVLSGFLDRYKNAIEIPEELAKQLEELGK